MEAEDETLMETSSLTQGASIMSTSNTGTDKVLISREGKRKRIAYLPTESVKILRDWLFEHRFKAYPSEAEKRMLSERTNLSFLQITNWFINARRRVLPEMLQQTGDDPNQITMYRPEGKAADVIHQEGIHPSIQAKSGPRDLEKMQCLPLCPLPTAQESGENLLNPESAAGQNFTRKAQPEEKVEISTSRSLFVSSPKPVSTEEYKDFSNFQLLVDVAVQKAAELELQKNQETNP